MSTANLIEDILRLSGPFRSKGAGRRHRRYLERRSTEQLLQRRRELLETAMRPGGQRDLRLDYIT